MIDISLIASSVRPHLWESCLDSLKGNECEFEVVFAGNTDRAIADPFYKKYSFFNYISTGNIKPAQCYEVARIAAEGRYLMWIADDCEMSTGLLDKIVYKMDAFPRKTLLSVKTNEDGMNNDLNHHRFFGFNVNTPFMAPLGVISNTYLQELGGFDRRYLCGQYENDVAMRVMSDGGEIVKFEEGVVSIEHLKKHGKSTKFWTGYDYDRKILEDTWVIGGYAPSPKPMRIIKMEEDCAIRHYFPIDNREVVKTPLLPFKKYEEKDILIKSQGLSAEEIQKGQWE